VLPNQKKQCCKITRFTDAPCSCEFLSFRSGAGEVWPPFYWGVALYSWRLVPARLFDLAQSSHIQAPKCQRGKARYCKNHSLPYAMDFCNIFCFCKNYHPKNTLQQITAAKCWFRHFYDMRNSLSTTATVCDHERETAESTPLPLQISGFD
jgi:hypothetical protein